MNRPLLACAFLALASAALCAQQSSPAYSGTASPPPDDTIETSEPQQPQPLPKPHAGKPMNAQPAAPAGQPGSTTNMDTNSGGDPNVGTDAGTVQVAPTADANPSLSTRTYVTATDPDGDIVHPEPLPPGVVGEGSIIRVHLLDQLSTRESEKGDPFRSRVASDVVEGGKVVIPTGAEIDGTVVDASSGTHLGSRGSMRLRPETVIMADGSRYQLQAYVAAAPGAHANVDREGTIGARSRVKRGGIEYAGAMGVGAIAGAVMGGPPGALAGTIIGAGAVTAHLLISHPQATLEPGTVLLFTLTQPLNLVSQTNAAVNQPTH